MWCVNEMFQCDCHLPHLIHQILSIHDPLSSSSFQQALPEHQYFIQCLPIFLSSYHFLLKKCIRKKNDSSLLQRRSRTVEFSRLNSYFWFWREGDGNGGNRRIINNQRLFTVKSEVNHLVDGVFRLVVIFHCPAKNERPQTDCPNGDPEYSWGCTHQKWER